jgi:hypothetical protein
MQRVLPQPFPKLLILLKTRGPIGSARNSNNLVEARGPRTDRCLLFVYYRVAVLAQIFFEFETTGGEIGSRSERAGAEEEGKLL